MLLALSIALADRMRFKDALEVLDSAERQFPDRVRTATTLARLAARRQIDRCVTASALRWPRACD